MKLPLRSFAALILAGLLALLAACTVNQPKLAGRINGTPIPYNSYMESYRGHYNNFQILNNRVPDAEEKEQIRRDTWKDATRHVILTDYFRKYGISVSGQEVLDTLRHNVPDYILNSPRFQSGGKFDYRIYLQSLQYDTPENLQPLRKHYQDYLIPILKLKQRLISDELLTPAEQKLSLRILQSKADIEWASVDPLLLEPLVTPEEIQLYYDKHPDEFKLDPQYSVLYATLPVSPSSRDVELGAALADTLLAELREGSSLEEALNKYLAYYPGLLLKNSGFIRNSDLDPVLYALLAETEEGSYTNPVADAEGLTIYQLEQRTKSMISFNTLRVPFNPSPASIEQAKAAAERASRLIAALGVAEAAEELELEIKTSGRVRAETDWLEDPAAVQAILRQIEEQDVGFVLAPVYVAAQRSWLVGALQDNTLNSVRTLMDVQSAIRSLLVGQKRVNMAQSLAGQIASGQISPPASSPWVLHGGMTYTSELGGVPTENLFYQILRDHYQGHPQKFHSHGDLLWIPRVISASTDKQVKIPAEEVARLFTQNLPENWFDNWMEGKIRQAKLKIYVQ